MIDRLTINYPDGAIGVNGTTEDMVLRLASYEDTGLDPKTIKDCTLIQDLIDSGITPAIISPLRHLLELAKAEAERRLLVLPCKIGTPIYWINFNMHDGYWIEPGLFSLGDFYAFGKSVFLTREEAEAALRKECEA